MKKGLALTIVAMLLVSLLAACGAPASSAAPEASSDAPAASTEAPAAGGQKHAMVFKNTGNPYGEKQMQGFEEIIKAAGHEAILRAPDQPTAEAQITIIDDLINQKVDSICIVGNDADALQPVLKKAMDKGIKVYSLDSGVNKDSRMVHVNQTSIADVGETLVKAAKDLVGSGEFAILSATSQATNQNAWIASMEEFLKDPAYADIKLVKTAYGDDLRDKSVSETEALLKSYPNLKCIVAPTTVGIAAAGKVISDKGLIGKVAVTGLGLPSEMAEYIDNKSCPYMFLWNPIDLGRLGAYTGMALVDGKISGTAGDSLTTATMGDFKVVAAADGGTEIILGAPFKFEPSNIAEWKSVY